MWHFPKADSMQRSSRVVSASILSLFTPRIFLQPIVQYNDQADLWSANARFGWMGAAGTGLLLVINETQGLGLLDESGPRYRLVPLQYSRLINLYGG